MNIQGSFGLEQEGSQQYKTEGVCHPWRSKASHLKWDDKLPKRIWTQTLQEESVLCSVIHIQCNIFAILGVLPVQSTVFS